MEAADLADIEKIAIKCPLSRTWVSGMLLRSE